MCCCFLVVEHRTSSSYQRLSHVFVDFFSNNRCRQISVCPVGVKKARSEDKVGSPCGGNNCQPPLTATEDQKIQSWPMAARQK